MTDRLKLRAGSLYCAKINRIRMFDRRGALIEIEKGEIVLCLGDYPKFINHHLFLYEDRVVDWYFPEENVSGWWKEIV